MPFKEMKGIEGVVEFKLALNCFLYPLQILLLLLFPRTEMKEKKMKSKEDSNDYDISVRIKRREK